MELTHLCPEVRRSSTTSTRSPWLRPQNTLGFNQNALNSILNPTVWRSQGAFNTDVYGLALGIHLVSLEVQGSRFKAARPRMFRQILSTNCPLVCIAWDHDSKPYSNILSKDWGRKDLADGLVDDFLQYGSTRL